jgi:hypothetical protein
MGIKAANYGFSDHCQQYWITIDSSRAISQARRVFATLPKIAPLVSLPTQFGSEGQVLQIRI